MSMRFSLISVAVLSAALAACGDVTNNAAVPEANSAAPVAAPVLAPVVVAPPAVEIAGVAATGAAIPNARVSVKCSVGSASTTTGSNGSYQVSITNGSLPCVVKVTSADAATVLHSAVEGVGAGKVNVNVSPMTELIVSETLKAPAATLFDQFDANKTKLTQSELDAAKDKVRAALASIVNLANVDPIKDALVAASATVAGNGLDQQLDKLRDALLASNLKLGDLIAVIAANRDGSVPEAIKTALQVPSTSCKGFKSGVYRVIEPAATTKVFDVTFDAATLKAVTPSGTVSLIANGCTLTALDGTKLTMATSGIGIMRTANNTLALVLPKQSLNLSDLTGEWFWLDRDVSQVSMQLPTATVSWGNIVVGANGQVTQNSECRLNTPCASSPTTALPQFSVRSDGGFSMSDSVDTQQFYGFRSANGIVVLVGVSNDGDILYARKGPKAEVRALNERYSRTDIGVNSAGVVDTSFFNAIYEVTGVNAAANSFTRRRLSDCRIDTITVATPFAQAWDRPAGSSKACDGLTNLSIPLAIGSTGDGLGIGAYVLPANNYFGISITVE